MQPSAGPMAGLAGKGMQNSNAHRCLDGDSYKIESEQDALLPQSEVRWVLTEMAWRCRAWLQGSAAEQHDLEVGRYAHCSPSPVRHNICLTLPA